ncbi:MAG: L,D-transpeptidase [Phormidesmis sp.]
MLAGSALALIFTLFNARPGLAQSPPITTPADTQSTGVQPAEASKAATQTAYTLGTQTHTQAGSRIVLNLSERRVYLYRGAMLVSSYPVAVGTAATPTPRGEFTISKMVVDPVWQSPWTGEITPPGPNSALGLRWLEFTTSEAGAFGFHGTPTIDSIGHAASNGCVRMRNEDVVALFSQVSVGTPMIIQ